MQNLLRLFSMTLLSLSALISCSSEKMKVELKINFQDPQVQFAVGKFMQMAVEHNIDISESSPDLTIIGEIDTIALAEEAYSIKKEGKTVKLTAGCPTGMMYGLYHIKDLLAAGESEIEDIKEEPNYSFRALKFNLPWDSYRRSEALQLHYETCRDTAFWESFLDMMVENRFNKLTLWNLHPFNYLVKTAKYPEANSFTDAEMEGWETFWKTLFRMAKQRGIETYLVNWNIFVSPEFARAHGVAEYCINGEYFIEKGDTSEIIKDYTRECVKEVIDKYPDLTGLGITLGEGMGGMTANEREEWILESFIQGIRMASRKIKFIHRVPLSAGKGSGGATDPLIEKMTRRTLDTLTCVDGPIIIELKYNWSHGHSSPNLFKVHGGKLTDAYWNPPPVNYKLAWMVRNEDFFMLRWGQPDFIRKHIALNNEKYINGYFIGSETYIPAVDYFTAKEKGNWEYAFERQWMYYMQWGRLLYNPQTPDTFFENSFETRFSEYGSSLFKAQTLVGRVPLIVASYWDATWDYTLYSEGMISIMGQETTQLLSLQQIVDKIPMDTVLMGVKEFIALQESGDSREGKITPLEMADSIQDFCTRALELTSNMKTGNNMDLLYEKSDIEVWANLGLYFAHKLRAAVDYQKYVTTAKPAAHQQAVTHLENATNAWEQVSLITSEIYRAVPLQHYNRNEDKYFHWNKVYEEVKAELDWLKNEAQL